MQEIGRITHRSWN